MSIAEDIKARLDIVETVSTYVPLKKSGRYFKAVCPFHSEKTPSFIVNPERQSWRCFGACATGGDVFSFVMRREGLDFSGALRLLADKTGISLSQVRDADRHEGLYRINHAAARFYRDVLESPDGKGALKYLADRGVNDEARSRFELGLSPAGWEGLKSHLLALGLSQDLAVEAGLLHRSEDGNTRDFFRGRLMFPIHDRRGRIVGFGARALDDSTPKYINTSKTSVFDKRGTLYGMHVAADSIRARSLGIVVEGYMDVIAAHQYEFTNVVASMGTALTEQQVSQLKSMARNFVLALDPDSAGQEATLRSLESSWPVLQREVAATPRGPTGVLYQREPLSLKISALPPGRDPDSLIREDTSEWERLISEAVPWMDFYITAVASRFDMSTGQGKAQAVEALVPTIASADFAEQEHYLRKIAEVIDVSEEALKASVGRNRTLGPGGGYRRSAPKAPEVSASILQGDAEEALEDYTLALLLSMPRLRDHVREFAPDAPEFFHSSGAREVFTHWLGCETIDDLWKSLDESLHDHVTQLINKDLVPSDRQESEAALSQCLRRLERRHLQEVQEGLLASEDASRPPPREMESPVSDVNARLKQLFSEQAR